MGGHTFLVSSLSFNESGEKIASGAGDRVVKLWNIKTGENEVTFKNLGYPVTAVSFSKNGKKIAACTEGGTIAVLNLEEYKGKTLKVHQGLIHSICLDSDGKKVAFGSYDGKVRIYDANLLTFLAFLQVHEQPVFSVSFSPCGEMVASGSCDGTNSLWDYEKSDDPKVLRGHTDWVNSVAFSNDGKKLISGSGDSSVRIWDLEGDKETRVLKGHTTAVLSVLFASAKQIDKVKKERFEFLKGKIKILKLFANTEYQAKK